MKRASTGVALVIAGVLLAFALFLFLRSFNPESVSKDRVQVGSKTSETVQDKAAGMRAIAGILAALAVVPILLAWAAVRPNSQIAQAVFFATMGAAFAYVAVRSWTPTQGFPILSVALGGGAALLFLISWRFLSGQAS